MTTTPTLGLSIYDTASGSSTTFLAYRLATSGLSSNMTILDTWAQATSTSVVALKTNSITTVNANLISANYFQATSGTITSYSTNMPINLKLDTTISGSATVNINSLGIRSLRKVDTSGNVIELTNNDLIKNRYYLFIYDGSQFLMGGYDAGSSGSSSGISYSGSLPIIITGSVISISITGSPPISFAGSVISLSTTGVTSGSYNQVIVDQWGRVTSASFVSTGTSYTGSPTISVTGSVISLSNSGVAAGNYLSANITVDAHGIITSASNGASASSVGAPSDSPFITSASSANLTNYRIITGGSNITIVSASSNGGTIIIHSTASFSGSAPIVVTGSVISHNTSGVTSGSYNQIVVDKWGHITSASFIASIISGSPTVTTGSVADRHLVIYSGSSGSQVSDGYISIDTSGNLNLGGSQIINYTENIVTNSGSSLYDINWATANLFEITMTGNRAITFSNLSAGRSITAMMIQDSTGSRVVTWPSVKWTGGSPMILSTSACAVDVVSFLVRSGDSTVYGFPAGLNMK